MKEFLLEEKSIKEPILEKEVELIDYIRVVWRRRRLIVFSTIISIMLAGIVSFFMPPVYEVTAQLRIGRVWDKEIESHYLTKELVGSDGFLSRVIKRLNLPLTPYIMKKRKTISVEVLEGGGASQRFPLLLNIQIRTNDPQQALDISNAVSSILIEEHQGRYEEKLKEYRSYEEELKREVGRIEEQINDLERMIKKQSLSPSVNAPSVILLQAQLEQKNVQLLNLKKELKDTRLNNASSIITEMTKLISPPILPKERISPKIELNMAIAGFLGFFLALTLALFLEHTRFRKET